MVKIKKGRRHHNLGSNPYQITFYQIHIKKTQILSLHAINKVHFSQVSHLLYSYFKSNVSVLIWKFKPTSVKQSCLAEKERIRVGTLTGIIIFI